MITFAALALIFMAVVAAADATNATHVPSLDEFVRLEIHNLTIYDALIGDRESRFQRGCKSLVRHLSQGERGINVTRMNTQFETLKSEGKTPEKWQLALETADQDGDGVVTVDEFCPRLATAMKEHQMQQLNQIPLDDYAQAAVKVEVCKIKLAAKALPSICSTEENNQGLVKRQAAESRLQLYAGISIAFGVIFLLSGILLMAMIPVPITIAFGVISIAISILFFVLAGFNYAEVDKLRQLRRNQ